MSKAGAIPRTSLVWLLAAQGVVFLPHLAHAPVWLGAVWLWVLIWRWQIYRGVWSFPGSGVKFGLILLCGIGLALSEGGRFGMTTMVSLLLLALILKLLELRRRRDLIIFCYLGYFVSATQYLIHSNLAAGLYGLLSVMVITAALLASHQSPQHHRFWRTFRKTGQLMLQAVPLMLILFLVVPRTGALWSVPADETRASTGMSDTLAPGDISELAQSDALAFRVTFDGPAPGPKDRYWRGLVLSSFDGRAWRQSQRQSLSSDIDWRQGPDAAWRKQVDWRGDKIRYQVMLEPTHERWLYSLTAPSQWDDEIGIGPEYRLQRREPVSQRIEYQVTSYLDYRLQSTRLNDWQFEQAIRLPSGSNPRTRRRVQSWRVELGSDQALIERLLQHFRRHFHYTLQPPQLGEHSVDEFLWETQAGFCEHFASGFVFALRAAGIPARVVVGYQGGQRSPLEDYWIVRQRDAHAWAEVWLEGKGWVRYDPTAAVAPSRIEQGLTEALTADESDPVTGTRGLSLSSQLSLRWDLVNYHWNRWVLSYDQRLRSALLEDWLGIKQPWRKAGLTVLVGGGLLGLIFLVALWWQRPRHHDRADGYFAHFCRKLARQGLPREVGEGPRDYARRLSRHRPDLARQVSKVVQYYELVAYANNRQALADLRRAVKQFRA